ncbi:MAG TPA: carboxypeptidase-like regulatory domain-containing protein, partial [Pyrinomonadaceae bacterium]|nr:carboxypeptidase-like regulatory domain-containing protein [Pyrinomonadaceae bacterium]
MISRNSKIKRNVTGLKSPLLCVAFLVCLTLVALGRATPPADSLRVTVTDAQQRPLPRAECVLLDVAVTGADVKTHAPATATADEQGVATFTNVAPGSYTLRVESKGFDSLTREGVVIAAGRTNEITVALAVAPVTESVTVSAPGDAATNV